MRHGGNSMLNEVVKSKKGVLLSGSPSSST